MYARVDLATSEVVATVYQIPEAWRVYEPVALADLTFAGMPGFGLFPVALAPDPAFNPATERLGDMVPGAFDPAFGTVAGVRPVLALSADELAAKQAALLAFAADWRWQREVGGVNVGGILVATDDRSKILLAGAEKKAVKDPNYVARWKIGDESVEVPAAQVIAMQEAQIAWVDETFSAYAIVAEAIKAGVLKTEPDIVAAFKTVLGQ